MTIMPCLYLLIIIIVLDKTNGIQKAFYSSKTPYKLPLLTLNLPLPPAGFESVCVQILARHGCRALEGRKYDKLTMTLWTQAKQEEVLTEYGRKLGENLQEFIAINDKLGRGELSGLGKIEHQVVTSGKSRTIASLNTFIEGLPSTLTSLIDYEPANQILLYFHDNNKYETYYRKDRQLKNKIRSIEMQLYSKQMARNLLERLYNVSFVDRLANRYNTIIDSELGKSIKNEVDAVRMFHGLYLTGSNLRVEGVESLLEKYFLSDESAWFAYLQDAKDYYEKGPAFLNRTITYDMAQILLDDFFLHSTQCSQIDLKYFLRAHFAHGETIIPFAALLQIPILSDKSTPFNDTYTYNGWIESFRTKCLFIFGLLESISDESKTMG
ncbi:unnamed protein product [Rotaria sordida]|uniref:Multiple inositol polyphosphate phosphatase 1 n=1 Tax=Rotaria sordida TaxID=392033 RepID=A0A815HH83_9BILA|nr:unnamed protein product [Rotaria sordida]CAF1602550.1 unnamed protein product [Rotaria sordida]